MMYARDTQSAWILDALTLIATEDVQTDGIPVSAVVPALFESYVKILHGIEANLAYLDNPLTKPEEAVLGFSDCEPIRTLVSASKHDPSRRLRWAEIARQLSLPFTAEFTWEWCHRRLQLGCWPRYVSGPADGVLQPEEALQLMAVLSPYTGKQSVTCRLAEMSVSDLSTPVLHQGSLQTVLEIIREPGYSNLPEYWWPEDRSWCVVSDYDLTFTLVGGSRDLCTALLENQSLECIEVSPSTRVDVYVAIPIT